MKFRPCIDIKDGKVVQIIGGTLSDTDKDTTITNFQTLKSPSEFAELYQKDRLTGGHVISLGPGNQDAVMSALRAYPGGLQVGGGITPDNAAGYLDAGASHVIVTSYVFSHGSIDMERLNRLVDTVGKKQLVLDLSCRKKNGRFFIVTDRWQKFTTVEINEKTLVNLSECCDEFLVHGVDVEGKMAGIQTELVELLGKYSPVPSTYAGGARQLSDLDTVRTVGKDRVDLTIGSALDLFGGSISYDQVVKWHHTNNR